MGIEGNVGIQSRLNERRLFYGSSLFSVEAFAFGAVALDRGVKCNNTDEEEDLMNTTCWIDMFGWNTATCPLKLTKNGSEYATDQSSFVDWGTNEIYDPLNNITYAPNTWRTLTKEEWGYVVSGRPNADHLCGFASIDGLEHGNVKGLILLPENFEVPAGLTFHYISDPENVFQMERISNGDYIGEEDIWPNICLVQPDPCNTETFNATIKTKFTHVDFVLFYTLLIHVHFFPLPSNNFALREHFL